MNLLISLELVVDVPTTEVKKAMAVAEVATNLVSKYYRDLSIEVVSSSIGQRKLTKEEKMRLVPPRTHYFNTETYVALCGRSKSRRTTSDWKRVDCKFCLKLQPESDQQRLL